MAEDSQAFFSNTLGTQIEEEKTDLDHIEPRQATLFLIDTSPPMFEEDSNTEESAFMKSILTYKNNMQMLCGFNRDDWMSLILFGTTEWDKDPETKNVLTVQKFHKVTLDMLKEIKGKIEDHEGYFNLLSSPSAYPLHDALWHAAQAFAGVKTVIITRKIVLLTCEDNPFADDVDERHRIRTRVSTFKNLGIDFRVIGLNNDFDHNKFYKELEIISNGMNPRSYKTLQLDDLEAEIQFPSRTISNIEWKFSKDVVVPVSIFTISTETRYPDSVSINKTSNEVLKSCLVYRKKKNSQDDEDEDEDEDDDNVNPEDEGKFNSDIIAAGGLAKFQEHGDKKIVFDVKEISMMFDHFTKGVETLCFKPIECDPMYYVQSAKFLTFNKAESSESQKQFFDTLVDKCATKELMAVCRITYRLHTAPNIFYFYPSIKKGGFYIYKMAYEDQIRNLDGALSQWVYKSNWRHHPDENALDVFEKIIRRSRIRFDASLFKNPKLGILIANIEALALDLDKTVLPPDSTLPSKKLEERLAEVMSEYNRIFPQEEEIPAKRVKLIDDTEMQIFARTNNVNKCTVPQLKEFLKQHNISTSNYKKDELVQKVYQFYENN